MEFDLGTLYVIFCVVASLGSLWAMQKITTDATMSTWMGKVKWGHRALIALTSVAFLISGAHTLYFESTPTPANFFLIFVLFMVLVVSVMRHMAAPIVQDRHYHFHNGRARQR